MTHREVTKDVVDGSEELLSGCRSSDFIGRGVLLLPHDLKEQEVASKLLDRGIAVMTSDREGHDVTTAGKALQTRAEARRLLSRVLSEDVI